MRTPKPDEISDLLSTHRTRSAHQHGNCQPYCCSIGTGKTTDLYARKFSLEVSCGAGQIACGCVCIFAGIGGRPQRKLVGDLVQ